MTDQHGMLTEDGRIIFYCHHLNEANRQKVANVKAVYEENEALKKEVDDLRFQLKTHVDALNNTVESYKEKVTDCLSLEIRIAELEANAKDGG